ncbi:hypothetical protein ALC53_02462 [Atta colombica]|uniref:Uncharacterized protein n=1 Tax=Atta colombica TaxID=520822 RepID=A0A195BQU4_9HYME|nr:hypothetical protein ALC53_02462 [Atta colombica]
MLLIIILLKQKILNFLNVVKIYAWKKLFRIIVFTERLTINFNLLTFVLMENKLLCDYKMSTYFNLQNFLLMDEVNTRRFSENTPQLQFKSQKPKEATNAENQIDRYISRNESIILSTSKFKNGDFDMRNEERRTTCEMLLARYKRKSFLHRIVTLIPLETFNWEMLPYPAYSVINFNLITFVLMKNNLTALVVALYFPLILLGESIVALNNISKNESIILSKHQRLFDLPNIKPDQLCAIVNASSDKSSMFHLLLKELNPSTGSVILTPRSNSDRLLSTMDAIYVYTFCIITCISTTITLFCSFLYMKISTNSSNNLHNIMIFKLLQLKEIHLTNCISVFDQLIKREENDPFLKRMIMGDVFTIMSTEKEVGVGEAPERQAKAEIHQKKVMNTKFICLLVRYVSPNDKKIKTQLLELLVILREFQDFRLLNNWEILKSYFTLAEDILALLNDNSIKAYLLFLKYLLNFNIFNALFQSRKILIHKLYTCSNQIISEVAQNFFSRLYIPEMQNIKHLINIYVGSEKKCNRLFNEIISAICKVRLYFQSENINCISFEPDIYKRHLEFHNKNLYSRH